MCKTYELPIYLLLKDMVFCNNKKIAEVPPLKNSKGGQVRGGGVGADLEEDEEVNPPKCCAQVCPPCGKLRKHNKRTMHGMRTGSHTLNVSTSSRLGPGSSVPYLDKI